MSGLLLGMVLSVCTLIIIIIIIIILLLLLKWCYYHCYLKLSILV
jgi:hypothetical protein